MTKIAIPQIDFVKTYSSTTIRPKPYSIKLSRELLLRRICFHCNKAKSPYLLKAKPEKIVEIAGCSSGFSSSSNVSGLNLCLTASFSLLGFWISIYSSLLQYHLTQERWEHGMASFGNGPYNGGGDFGTRESSSKTMIILEVFEISPYNWLIMICCKSDQCLLLIQEQEILNHLERTMMSENQTCYFRKKPTIETHSFATQIFKARNHSFNSLPLVQHGNHLHICIQSRYSHIRKSPKPHADLSFLPCPFVVPLRKIHVPRTYLFEIPILSPYSSQISTAFLLQRLCNISQ
ncbi:hypothetical protein NC653_040613 [Populus alba x Populus x berolinensis]|uniref:Uncharacterized protein n=1 Tax=Populus alba x Populus x berolinensis TaxID=444605 RepID=A0AAD6L7L1_9ROSI|nr:hypothetical protein NC653_040613 [Populus alba x Populus x berolinensis]